MCGCRWTYCCLLERACAGRDCDRVDDTCEIEVTSPSETLKGSLHLQCIGFNTPESEIFKYAACAGVCVCIWLRNKAGRLIWIPRESVISAEASRYYIRWLSGMEAAIILNLTCLNFHTTNCNSIGKNWWYHANNDPLIVCVTLQSETWLRCLCVSMCTHVCGFILYCYSMYRSSMLIMFLRRVLLAVGPSSWKYFPGLRWIHRWYII